MVFFQHEQGCTLLCRELPEGGLALRNCTGKLQDEMRFCRCLEDRPP